MLGSDVKDQDGIIVGVRYIEKVGRRVPYFRGYRLTNSQILLQIEEICI